MFRHACSYRTTFLAGLLLGACTGPTTSPESEGTAFVVTGILDVWGAVLPVDQGAPFAVNTAAMEGCPAESADGNTLFMASNRDGQIDIWFSTRPGAGAPWGPPEKVPAPISLDGVNDFCPGPHPGDELLFVSTRPGGCGAADIYVTRRHPTGGWADPEHLGCEVNSAGNEFSPTIIEAGGGQLFFSSDVGGGPGLDRIYLSRRVPGGAWGTPVEVAELNADGFSTARPRISQDGRVIVFDSNRPGGSGGPDVWASTRHSVNHPWSLPMNLGPGINSAAAETRAWLSRDGNRLYFGSTRAGGQGSTDLYVTTRR